MNYVIVDVVKRALEAPDTFNIPVQAARERLKIGMLAKLVFEKPPPHPDGCSGERMWVKVASIDPNLKLKYAGELVNTPVVVEGLKPGDVVRVRTGARRRLQRGGGVAWLNWRSRARSRWLGRFCVRPRATRSKSARSRGPTRGVTVDQHRDGGRRLDRDRLPNDRADLALRATREEDSTRCARRGGRLPRRRAAAKVTDEEARHEVILIGFVVGAAVGWILIWCLAPWLPKEDARPAAVIAVACALAGAAISSLRRS